MIEARELRVGNLFEVDVMGIDLKVIRTVFTVTPTVIRDAAHYKDGYNGYPIKLDYVWLRAAGFKDAHTAGYELELEPGFKIHVAEGIAGQFTTTIGAFLRFPCVYVHQLQNLYFALTGEEIKIDLS